MSPATMKLWERFRAMPRATQWAAWAGAATVVTLLWTDVIMVSANAWNADADRMLAAMEEARSGADRLTRLDALQDYVLATGAVSPPEGQAEAADALADAINEVLAGHSVTGDSIQIRPPSKLPRTAMSAILGPEESAYRLSAELRFDATPDEAVAIIAALEARPEIESISSVRLEKRTTTKVSADLTLESWFIRREKARGGGST